jgi:tetratricopeptide (TPR) repeat protein
MNQLRQRITNRGLIVFCITIVLLQAGVTQLAQTKQLPQPTAHVNDFAGVLDEAAKQKLENLLANFKLKSGIEFDIATVESTGGQDISDFSLQVARDWNVGTRTSAKKSLLLVLAVTEKVSFTRFSRSVQSDLPEGVLGEMSQRMRAFVDAGKFGDGLNAGVKHFVTSVGEKLAFSVDDLDKEPTNATPVTDVTPVKATDEVAAAVTTAERDAPRINPIKSAPHSEPLATRPKRVVATADDDAESEEVEVTLALPLEKRAAALKSFIEQHPDSKSRGRALELLVSTHAGLGDELLKKADHAGGIEQFMRAIEVAPANPSEKLFAGVISQVPLNLYLRGESEAAIKAAHEIETKFGRDAKRLAILSTFYISMEQGAEAVRLATQATQLAPDLPEAHQALGRALHISLRLDEAAAEYKRALELDPSSRVANQSLADLLRSSGKADDAIALYRKQLLAQPADKAARNGLILAQLEAGQLEDGKRALDETLQTEPRNLSLLAGAAYWFAAHNEPDRAFDLARKAVDIEPRYTWAQIALARSLIAQRKPLEAERALRFARQYGKFPTLEYELASALYAAGLYEETAEVLMQAFSWKSGDIETRLAGQSVVRKDNFSDLLAPERRASIFQFAAADNENNARALKALLAFATAIDPDLNGGTISEQTAIAAAKEFASGTDPARVYRELYAASRLLQRGVGFATAFELAEAARTSADAGMTVPELTLAVQADEFRNIRARAIASGATPAIPEAPRNVLSNLLRGRIEDTAGWAQLNQEKPEEAAGHFRRAVAILPEGTPAARTALWHLGAALERQDKKTEALSFYIRSYTSGDPDPTRRTVIEQLYRKINGSLDGLAERLGERASASVDQSVPASESASEKAPDTTQAAPASSPTETPAVTETPVPTPEATPETAAPAPTPEPAAPTAATNSNSSLSASPVERMGKPIRSTVSITGKIKDGNGKGVANVVVVLISPQGSVLASTTDAQGNFSFSLAPSVTTRSYRIIPSKDGFVFDPVDRVLPVSIDDFKDQDFAAVVK